MRTFFLSAAVYRGDAKWQIEKNTLSFDRNIPCNDPISLWSNLNTTRQAETIMWKGRCCVTGLMHTLGLCIHNVIMYDCCTHVVVRMRNV